MGFNMKEAKMFIIIILILAVDTIMLCIFAVKCNPADQNSLIPMYALQVIGYAALYRIYLKMKGGRREKLADTLQKLREENAALKEKLGEKSPNENSEKH